MKYNKHKLFYIDEELYERNWFNIEKALRKYGDLPHFYMDDIYVTSRTSLGFKRNISENLNIDRFEDSLIKGDPKYTKEFLEQYEIKKDGVYRRDNLIKIEGSELPIMIKIKKDDPDWQEAYESWILDSGNR